MKIIAVNGGPRKKWNTATLLNKAIDGAKDTGADVELYHLYDLNYRGCTSCFACKLRNSKSLGRCAEKDDLSELLDKAISADGLLLASPIYINYVTGNMQSFLERLLYMNITYDKDEFTMFKGSMPVGFIYTMGLPAKMQERFSHTYNFHKDYFPKVLNSQCFEYMMAANTYQFNDYSKYVTSSIDPEKKAASRDKNFPLELERAYNIGKTIAEAAKNK